MKVWQIIFVAGLVASHVAAATTTGPATRPYFTLRGGLTNSQITFERTKTGRVVFLGGSITHMKGWRDLVCQDLQRRFPDTHFDFIDAGILSMGSTPGAFRFSRDVLAHGPVDLLFEDAAVNDELNGQTDVEQIRGMEGIVRQCRLANPATDIVLLYFVDPLKMKVIRQGKTPAVIENHDKVAAYYDVPALNLAQEVTDRIDAGEFSWEKDFKGLHPAPFGQALYARAIGGLLDAAWSGPSPPGEVRPHSLPAKPLDANSYFRGHFVDIAQASLGDGWRLDPSWRPADGVGTRSGFVDVPALVADQPGATLHLKFDGSAVGIFVASGPDAGTIEYSIDQGPWMSRDLWTTWSPRLHLPWAQILAATLPAGPHELTLRVSATHNSQSKTPAAVRIFHFLVNASPPAP